ncbi:MAG: hypothetical protein JRE18_00640 [Deltaproteobacteria bacterium]|nr:hypothetical protein [Deltaproteobacteria bacterium]MBW2485086.1 hypothetical protein [Deltaproteobacteria bacterium]
MNDSENHLVVIPVTNISCRVRLRFLAPVPNKGKITINITDQAMRNDGDEMMGVPA